MCVKFSVRRLHFVSSVRAETRYCRLAAHSPSCRTIPIGFVCPHHVHRPIHHSCYSSSPQDPLFPSSPLPLLPPFPSSPPSPTRAPPDSSLMLFRLSTGPPCATVSLNRPREAIQWKPSPSRSSANYKRLFFVHPVTFSK